MVLQARRQEATFVVYMIDGLDGLFRINRERLQAYLEDNWQKGNGRPWRVVQGGEVSGLHDPDSGEGVYRALQRNLGVVLTLTD